MNITDAPLPKRIKDSLRNANIETTEQLKEVGIEALERYRNFGKKGCEITFAAFLVSNQEVTERVEKIIKSARSIENLFNIEPFEAVDLVIRNGGRLNEKWDVKRYKALELAYVKKAAEFLKIHAFEERWRIWKIRTSKLYNQADTWERPKWVRSYYDENGERVIVTSCPRFALDKITELAIVSSLEVANFPQAHRVWKHIHQSPTGVKAIERMSRLAKTMEEHWQVAVLAKNRLPEIWKKSIRFLAKKA